MRAVVLLLVAFSIHPVWAKSIFVAPVEGRGVSVDQAATATELIKSAVDSTSGYSTSEYTTEASVLRGTLLKLGESYIFTLRLSEGGARAKTSELKLRSFDEIDAVAKRLVANVLVGERSARLGEITEDESNPNLRRIKTIGQVHFGFGPAWTSGLKDAKPASVWGLGYSWFPQTDFELSLLAEYLAGKSAFSTATVGLGYYPLRTSHSPFVMAEFGYGWVTLASDCKGLCLMDKLNRERASGWVVGGGLGYKFFRTSTVNLSIVGRYDYMAEQTSLGHPTRGSVRLVISY